MPKIENVAVFLSFLMPSVLNQRDLLSDKSKKQIVVAFDKCSF